MVQGTPLESVPSGQEMELPAVRPPTGRLPRAGMAASQGTRPDMQDVSEAWEDISQADNLREDSGKGASTPSVPHIAYFGVYDGHDGRAAAAFTQRHLLPLLVQQSSFPSDPAQALNDAILETERQYYQHVKHTGRKSAGTTVLSALVFSEDLFVANVGDSRAVLCRRGSAVVLTTDHKPKDPDEANRIRKEGGHVVKGYLNDKLGVSRAIGDFHLGSLKYFEYGSLAGPLTAKPDVKQHPLQEEDEFMVLACDGLWDVLSSERVVELARQHLRQHNDPSQCAQELVDEALRRGSGDNVSVIVVAFGPDPPPRRECGANSMLRCLSTDGVSTLTNALMDAEPTQGSKLIVV